MHSYSLDTEIRRTVYVVLGIIAISVPSVFAKVRTAFGIDPAVGFPLSFGAIFGLLHLVFDKWLWRKFSGVLDVPDVNGKWVGLGLSSYPDPSTGQSVQFSMVVTIKQTFSKLEVFAETKDSTSRSTLAGFCTQQAMPLFRYAFENTQKNKADDELHRHPGLIELRLEAPDRMTGDYFSGKHRLRHGELRLERKKP